MPIHILFWKEQWVWGTENTGAGQKQRLKIMLQLGHAWQKINNTLVDSAEDLDIVMLMYNLLEYSQNYSMTGCLWNYYREEINDVDNNASDGKSFKYKTKLIINWKNRGKICTTSTARFRSWWKSTAFKHRSHYSTQIS